MSKSKAIVVEEFPQIKVITADGTSHVMGNEEQVISSLLHQKAIGAFAAPFKIVEYNEENETDGMIIAEVGTPDSKEKEKALKALKTVTEQKDQEIADLKSQLEELKSKKK